MSSYDRGFYADRHAMTEYAAQTVLSIALAEYGPITSAVDIGCGVGTWLSVSRSYGVERIQGVDGPWVDRDLLEIPCEAFLECDLQDSGLDVPVDGRFDLAICLEVAEHLQPPLAERLVSLLCDTADVVLFSAAVPG